MMFEFNIQITVVQLHIWTSHTLCSSDSHGLWLCPAGALTPILRRSRRSSITLDRRTNPRADLTGAASLSRGCCWIHSYRKRARPVFFMCRSRYQSVNLNAPLARWYRMRRERGRRGKQVCATDRLVSKLPLAVSRSRALALPSR
jgi:hypothetical protein